MAKMIWLVCPACYELVDYSCTCDRHDEHDGPKRLIRSYNDETEACPYCGSSEPAGFWFEQSIALDDAIQGNKGSFTNGYELAQERKRKLRRRKEATMRDTREKEEIMSEEEKVLETAWKRKFETRKETSFLVLSGTGDDTETTDEVIDQLNAYRAVVGSRDNQLVNKQKAIDTLIRAADISARRFRTLSAMYRATSSEYAIAEAQRSIDNIMSEDFV